MAEKKKDAITSLDDFNKLFSAARVDVRNLAHNAGFHSTGSITFDYRLGGGLPKGTIVEFFGPSQSGKSTVALHTLGVALNEGKKVAIFDLERGIDFSKEHDGEEIVELIREAREDEEVAERRDSWLRTNGVDPFHPNLHLYDPEHGEEMYDMLAKIVKHNLFDLVLVDSMAAVVTRAQMEGEPGESHYGTVAKLNATELPRLFRLYRGNQNTTIIFINQIRDKIGFMQKGQKSTGGHALEHFARTKVKFSKVGRKELDDDVITETIVRVEKAFAKPSQFTIYISSKRGLDTMAELLDVAVDFGYVRSSGNWNYLFTEPVEVEVFSKHQKAKTVDQIPGYVARINGRASVLDWMANQKDWTAKIRELAVKTAHR